MPFDGEFAAYEPLRRILSNQRIRELENDIVALDVDQLTSYDTSHLEIDISNENVTLPQYIFAIDGSYHAQSIYNGFPGAEIGYITISASLIFFDDLTKLSTDEFIKPKEYRNTQKSLSLDTIIAGCNVVLKGEKSAKSSMRKMLYNEMSKFKVFDNSETLLDTYEYLLSLKIKKGFTQKAKSPLEDVTSDMQYGSGSYNCSQTGEALFSTDALRLHELFNTSESNGELYGQIMSMFEKVWLIHILRAFEKYNYLEFIKDSILILDGPLACFSSWSWLKNPIFEELNRINNKQKKLTGQDLLIIGIEKSGTFANHFELIDTYKSGVADKIKPNTLLSLSDKYIKEHVIFSNSTKVYGQDTYFGKKLFFKTRENYRLVVNLVDFDYEDDVIYERMTAALNNLTSNLYPNSIMPLTVAHSEAAIPLNLGKKIFEKIAEKIAANK